jgi:hypothetical protein
MQTLPTKAADESGRTRERGHPRPRGGTLYLRCYQTESTRRTNDASGGLNKPYELQQLSARRYRTQEVAGSSPASSTRKRLHDRHTGRRRSGGEKTRRPLDRLRGSVKGVRVIQPVGASSASTTESPTNVNPDIRITLLIPAMVQGVVIAGAGIVLFFAPDTGHDIWGWELTPFNTRFLGAIYLAALVDFVALSVVRRWRPARLVMPMDLLFMTIVLLVSLAYVDRFKWERPVTWAWFAIFASVPVYASWFLLRFRRFWRLAPVAPNPRLRRALVGGAVPLAVYGVGLVSAPGTFAGFWPWHVDAFHGRIYSAIFLTLALATVIASRGVAPLELGMLGLTCIALGALEPIGVLVVDANVDKVEWSSAGTWAWIAMFAAIFAYGVALSGASLRREISVAETPPA